MKNQTFKEKVYDVIFESDTPAGKGFDVLLIVTILLSVVVVLLDSVPYYNLHYGDLLYKFEWLFTILFTLEYLFRIYSIGRPIKYITSFFGVIDLLAILPTFIGIFFPAYRIYIETNNLDMS